MSMLNPIVVLRRYSLPCRNSHADAVRVLLEHAGVDVNLLNNAGESALSRASTAAIRDLLTARGAR